MKPISLSILYLAIALAATCSLADDSPTASQQRAVNLKDALVLLPPGTTQTAIILDDSPSSPLQKVPPRSPEQWDEVLARVPAGTEANVIGFDKTETNLRSGYKVIHHWMKVLVGSVEGWVGTWLADLKVSASPTAPEYTLRSLSILNPELVVQVYVPSFNESTDMAEVERVLRIITERHGIDRAELSRGQKEKVIASSLKGKFKEGKIK